MDKRKERMFNPEEQVDFVKLVETLDWTKEIDPVYLVKTVNKVAGLKGTKQYKTNEVSFGLLLKSFEKRVIDFVNVRFCGKDRFYTLKDKVSREEVIHFVKTGKKLEIDTTAIPKKKEDFSKYYAPIPEEKTAAVVKKKRTFPDDEALLKTVYLLWTLKKHSGSVEAKVIMEIKHTEGWKNQRACAGKQYTVYQEANAVCTQFLDMKDPIEVINKKTVKFNGSLEGLDSKINDVISLIEDKGIKEKATGIVVVKTEEPKPVLSPEPKPEIVKPVMDKEPIKAAPIKPTGRVIISSPEVGRSTFESLHTTVTYENTKTRWSKSLVAEVLYSGGKTKRGMYFGYLDIQAKIKRTRYVDLSVVEIKNIISEIFEKQFRGIGRTDREGVSIGSEVMLAELMKKYDASKITETIFIRLKMGIQEIQERYPELQVSVASEICGDDNIYKIEANRSEKTERALAKLFWCLRNGEVILESPNNWTLKRIETLQEKLGLY